jgi:hypothetical protein
MLFLSFSFSSSSAAYLLLTPTADVDGPQRTFSVGGRASASRGAGPSFVAGHFSARSERLIFNIDQF